MSSELTTKNERKVIINTTQSLSIRIAITAIFIALETVATMLISIVIPISKGYFNVGEGIIYIAAILYGPMTGALTGGIS